MTCARIRDLFGAYWDDETTQAERELIETHLAGCPACRAEYDAFARALELVGSLPRVEAAPDLIERVRAGARRATRVPDRLPAPSPRWVPIAATAAVALVAALTVLPWLAQRADRFAHAPSAGLATREPALVRVQPARTTAVPGGPAAGGAAGVARSAAVTDSLFDHSEDVEFMVDPVALRRGRAAGARSATHGIRTGDASISF